MKRIGRIKFLYLLMASLGCAPMVAVAQQGAHELTVKDLAYGVSLYHFYQNRYLDAIIELDVGEFRQTLDSQPDDAEFLKGGLYFSYGLEQDAVSIFNDLLEKKTDAGTRDRIWFSLARIAYDKGNRDQAREMLARIEGDLPERFEDQKQYLLANLHIERGQFGEAANSSNRISENSIWKAYTQFNLGIALKQNWEASREWLGRVSKLALFAPRDEELQALADRAQLALGLYSMEKRDINSGIAYISGIRSSGPLSNRGLLAAGWGWSRVNAPDRALGHWQSLRDKNQNDEASLEALLAIPHAFEQKGNRELSALYYDQAAGRFDRLLMEMDEVIAATREGDFIDALRLNWQQEKKRPGDHPLSLPRGSATPFVHQALAQKSLQNEIRQFNELLDIEQSLTQWQTDLPALDLMLKERRAAFEGKKPQVEEFSGFALLDDIRRRRETLAAEVSRIEREEDYHALADEDEAGYLEQLAEVRTILDRLEGSRELAEENDKYRLIAGLLNWQIETEFPARIWRLKNALRSLDQALDLANTKAASLQGAAGYNERGLGEFQQRIDGQYEATRQLAAQVAELIERQEQHISMLVIEAIQARKEHLKQLRLNARYSLVRLYDALATSKAANQ